MEKKITTREEIIVMAGICKKCGKETNTLYASNLCQGCYRYYKDGGTDNVPPPEGVIKYDKRGYIICHICGRAYKRLGSHVRESHGMTISEYKYKYGLCESSKTTEHNYSLKMHNYAIENNMPQQLVEKGRMTRFKKGEKARLGKPVRLQECLNKRRD